MLFREEFMTAIELLIEDHRRVNSLFVQIQQASEVKEKQRIFQEIKKELEAHTFVEETVFYPYFSRIDQFKEMIDEAYAEHQEVKGSNQVASEAAA
jgi:hemerythrin superfamily protein